jgi:hypothetical protein
VCAAIFDNDIAEFDSRQSWREKLDRAAAYVLRAETHCRRYWTPQKIAENRMIFEQEYIYANMFNDGKMTRRDLNLEIAKLFPESFLYYPKVSGQRDLLEYLDGKLNLREGKDAKRKFRNFLESFEANHFMTDLPWSFAQELSNHCDDKAGYFFNVNNIDNLIAWRKTLKKKGGIKPHIAVAKKFGAERVGVMVSNYEGEKIIGLHPDDPVKQKQKEAFWAKARAYLVTQAGK